MTGSSSQRERPLANDDPTPSMLGRSRAARDATHRAIADQVRTPPEQPPFEWRRPDGTAIDIPTVLADFAHAVGMEISAMKAEVGGLYDAIGENTDATKKIAEDTAELVKVAKSVKGTVDVLSWVGKVAKGLFWVIVTIAVAGALLYGTIVERAVPSSAAPTAPAK